MTSEEDALPSIIVPGPELREKVNSFAARLSTLDKSKADEMIAKLLASNRRNEFIFVESSHLFYPYFLSMLTEYRAHPEKRPQKASKTEGGAAPAATTSSAATTGATTTTATTTTTTDADGIVRTEGGTAPLDAKREELLWQAEQEARRYLEDPFPSHYALDLKEDTIDLPPFAMDLMALTAQFSAKYGETFLRSVEAKQKRNPSFRFLQEDDVRHSVFKQLVEAYRLILAFDADETETRLEHMTEQPYILDTVVAEKTKYAQAALARRQAALLTDDQLRATLNWTAFKVVKTFSLSDLLLDGVVPPTATSHQRHPVARAAPPPPPAEATAAAAAASASSSDASHAHPSGAPPSFAPVFMSSNLLSGTTNSGSGSSNNNNNNHNNNNNNKLGGRPAPPAAPHLRHQQQQQHYVEEDDDEDPTAVYTVLEEVGEVEDSAYTVDPITGARVLKKRSRDE